MEENPIGRYVITENGIVKIENIQDYIGKTVILRTPQCCKNEFGICSICAGEYMSKYPNGVSILVTDISGNLLNASLKRMHASKSVSMKFNISEALS